MIELFLKLILCHVFMDYWAQSDALAKMKNHKRDNSTFCPKGQKLQAVWPYALSAHAMMHGAAVWLVTGNVWLFFAESVSHAVIDYGKCDNRYGMHLDQALHILCKVVWLGIIIWSTK